MAFYLRQVATGITLVNQVSRCLKLLFCHRALHLYDSVLHFSLIDHQNDQNPVTGQREKLDLTQLARRRFGHRYDAGLIGHLGEEIRGALNQLTRAAIRIQPGIER